MRRAAAVVAMHTLLSLPASAQWQGAIGLSERHWTNTERDQTGRQLVREAGWLPGIAARAAHQGDDWTWYTEATLHDKAIAYHGQTQAGQARESRTSTRLALLRLGGAHDVNASVALFATLEWQRWTRDIEGVQGAGGLQERADARRISAGVRQQWQAAGIGAMRVDAALVIAAPERLRVGFSGVLDPASLETRWAQGFRFGASMRPAFAPQLELHAGYDWIKVARSADAPVTLDGRLVGTMMQPEHGMRAITLTASCIF